MSFSDWTFYVAVEAAKWLTSAVYFLGLCVSVWAFRRCRKRAYLVVGAYFALTLFVWHIWPHINQAIHAAQTPMAGQQAYDAAVQKGIRQALAEAGNPSPPPYRIRIEIAPMVLVFGLWLLARNEPKHNRPDSSPEPKPSAPSTFTTLQHEK